jgi:hypothetical protein
VPNLSEKSHPVVISGPPLSVFSLMTLPAVPTCAIPGDLVWNFPGCCNDRPGDEGSGRRSWSQEERANLHATKACPGSSRESRNGRRIMKGRKATLRFETVSGGGSLRSCVGSQAARERRGTRDGV